MSKNSALHLPLYGREDSNPHSPRLFAHHTCNHFRVSLISHAAVCANFRLSSVPSSFRSAILGVPFQDRSVPLRGLFADVSISLAEHPERYVEHQNKEYSNYSMMEGVGDHCCVPFWAPSRRPVLCCHRFNAFTRGSLSAGGLYTGSLYSFSALTTSRRPHRTFKKIFYHLNILIIFPIRLWVYCYVVEPTENFFPKPFGGFAKSP